MPHFHSSACTHCPPAQPQNPTKVRSLWLALVLIVSFAVAELTMGYLSHSLALVAESEHLLSDGLSLGLALLATWIAQLPASDRAPFGYRRVEILAALVNGVGLFIVAGWIGWEAIGRLQEPPTEILSLPMLVTAIVGLGINLLNAALLHQDSHDDLNLRGAFLHMIADAVSSVGVILAAIGIMGFGWNWADGTISLGVAILIGLGTIPLIRQSLNILLEAAPDHLDYSQIQAHLESFPGVVTVKNLRIWTIALGQEALSAHLVVNLKEGELRDRLLNQIETSLQQKFSIAETCLQMTAVPATLISLSVPERLEFVSLSASGQGDPTEPNSSQLP